MKQLEELLAIPDRKERQQALLEYARTLKVDPQKARKEGGDLSEDRLTVLIYDALQSRKMAKFQVTGLLIGGALMLIVGLIMIFLAVQMKTIF